MAKQPAQQGSPKIDQEYALLPLDELRELENNPRIGDVASLAESMSELGFYGAVIVDRETRTVLAGNHRVKAARASGLTEVPCILVDGSGQRGKKIALADNRFAELGQFDPDVLLRELQALDGDLFGTGYGNDALADLMEFGAHPFDTMTVDIASLRRHPQNYQSHPEDQLAHIMRSIEENGFYRNVVVARDMTILAGHGVVEAATKMGRTRVPVIKLDLDPTEPRALKVLVSDNEINNLAEVDDRLLTELLRTIMHSSDEPDTEQLTGTGFNGEQLALLTMVTRHSSEIEDENAAAEWLGLPDYTGSEKVLKVVVNFENEADRNDFATTLGIKTEIVERRSMWWPPRKYRTDLKNLEFVENPEGGAIEGGVLDG